MDFHRGFLSLGLIFVTLHAGAENLYAPQGCQPKELELTAINETGEEAPFWLQVRDGLRLKELPILLEAQSKRRIAGTDFLALGESFVVKHETKGLRFELTCAGTATMTPLTSPRVDFLPTRWSGDSKLLVQNLSPTDAKPLRVSYLSKSGEVLRTLNFTSALPYQTSETILPSVRGATTIRLEGDARFSARLIDVRSSGSVATRAPAAITVKAPEASAYFLLSDDDNSESFVIRLDDSKLIEEARDIVKRGLYKRAIALVEPATSLGINRNFAADDRSPWSWSVKSVSGFADFGHISCDGSPSLIEERFQEWMGTLEPQICFWNFNLKKELTPEEVSTGRFSVARARTP